MDQFFPGKDAMDSPHKDVRRAIALARILTRLLLHRLRHSIALSSLLASLLLLATILIIAPWGCTPKTQDSAVPLSGRLIRVRLMQSQDQVTLKPAGVFTFRSNDSIERQIAIQTNSSLVLSLKPDGWHAGTWNLGSGELTLRPLVEGQLRINDRAYRG